jgi:ferritin-like metal-binding protein YciE
MAIQNAEELFVAMLSNLHVSEQRLAKFTDELAQNAQDPEVKNILSVRSFLTMQNVANIEKCFQLIGKQPAQANPQLAETMAENFRRTMGEIQQPGMKALYALWAIREIQNFHIGEYMTLTMASEEWGNVAVTNLLHHCLADKVDFVERTREFVREAAKKYFATRAMPKAA